MRHLIASTLACIIIFSACKKPETYQIAREEEPEVMSDFVQCDCLADTLKNGEGVLQEFISAEVNGVPICADLEGNFSTQSFGNMLKWGNVIRESGTTYYDNLYMVRNTRDTRWMIAIFLENSHALTKVYPYQLPRANPEYCEIGEIQFINQMQQGTSNCFSCMENEHHYLASFFAGGCKLIVENYQNGVLTGKFNGQVRTGSGKTAVITNGKFRILLDEINVDIDVR